MRKKNLMRMGISLLAFLSSLPAGADRSPFVLGPYVKHLTPQTAELSWQTAKPVSALVEIKQDDRVIQTLPAPSDTIAPRLLIQHMEPKTKYVYQITLGVGEARVVSPTYEIDTALNYTPYPLPLPSSSSPFADHPDSERFQETARFILQQTQITKGYCLVYGCEEGQLAYELARQSELTVIGVDDDPARIQDLRQRFVQAHLYGVRFTFHSVKSLESLPFPDCFANLIVSETLLQEGNCEGSADEVLRVLRPSGGVVCLGWKKEDGQESLRESRKTWSQALSIPTQWKDTDRETWLIAQRPSLSGIGAWTHQYGDPTNSSNSGETLCGITQTHQLEVQWIGRPGADFGIDRNPRMPSPLSSNGRLFHQGMNRIAALDAYNGTILWSMEIPDLRRVNIPRDASNWCADDDRLYVAILDQCWILDALNGDLHKAFSLPTSIDAAQYDWGFIANQDNRIFGSCVKKGSVYTDFFGNESWYDQKSGYGTGKICSDLLFAYDKQSGAPLWEYQNGVIINTTLAIAEGKIFFVESRHPSLKELPTSRIENPELWLDQYLVALDATTGQIVWEKSIDTHDGIVVFYLTYAESSVLVTSSGTGGYHMYSFNAANGSDQWHATHPWPNDNHGGHMQHPAIVGQTVYLEPCGYDLKTGERITESIGRHEGCATYAATSNALIYRGNDRQISLWDVASGEVTSWFNLRPSCWLSVIPAGGMILAPEGGGGCSCGNWLETSIGFSPFHNHIQ